MLTVHPHVCGEHFQFRFKGFLYDFRCENILIEFDEPHHKDDRQNLIDDDKNNTAIVNGYKILRFELAHDVIDMIILIDNNIMRSIQS